LTVVLQPGNPPTHAILLLPDQQGSANTIRLTSASDIAAINQQQVTLPIPQRLQVGDQITAIILPPEKTIPLMEETPASQANDAPQTQPPLTSGSQPNQQPTAQATTQPSTVGSPATPTQPTNAQIQPSVAPLSTSLPATPTPNIVAQKIALPPGFSYGQEIPLTVQNVEEPAAAAVNAGSNTSPIATTQSQAAPIITPSSTGNTTTPALVQATVVGTTANGQMVLQTDGAHLYVRQPVDLPIGATVTLSVQQPKAVTPVVLQQSPQPNPLPALPEIISALQQTNPGVAQTLTQNILPNPTANLGGALLFIFSALRQGDVRGWLGSNVVDALERAGKFELVHQLSTELRDSVTQDTAADQYIWRTYNLPLYAEGRMAPIYLHVRDEQSHNTAPAGNALHGLRFMLDVEMSRLGSIQIDGLSRLKKLDIVLRSEKALPIDVPTGLRDYYQSFLDSLGYTGSLGFQTGRQHWLNLKQQPKTTPMVT
ncbi:MAG: hypothetical protein JO253_00530, partial [Alphaproteobacteria bacterium]|nr:hypothetical protein [Alphaproteobacteria bacterium]